MKKLFYVAALCCAMMVALTACNPETEIGTREQVIGRWQGTNPTAETWFFVFLDEPASEGYAWGYQFDEVSGSPEQFVVEEDFHKNGWFQWKKGDKYLRMRHMSTGSEAEAAIDQTLYVLTDTDLQFDDAGKRVYFKKIIPAEPEQEPEQQQEENQEESEQQEDTPES